MVLDNLFFVLYSDGIRFDILLVVSFFFDFFRGLVDGDF